MRARAVLCCLELRQPLLEFALSMDGRREQCDPSPADSLCAALCTECQLRVLRVEHGSVCGSHIFHMWGTHRLLAGLRQPLHEPPKQASVSMGGVRMAVECVLSACYR